MKVECWGDRRLLSVLERGIWVPASVELLGGVGWWEAFSVISRKRGWRRILREGTMVFRTKIR